jgi:hypothetical protein
MLIEHHPSYLN